MNTSRGPVPVRANTVTVPLFALVLHYLVYDLANVIMHFFCVVLHSAIEFLNSFMLCL